MKKANRIARTTRIESISIQTYTKHLNLMQPRNMIRYNQLNVDYEQLPQLITALTEIQLEREKLQVQGA